MSNGIIRYVLVDREDHEQDHEYLEHEYDDAEIQARRLGYAIIAREYGSPVRPRAGQPTSALGVR